MEILYPYGYLNGGPVHITDAHKGAEYRCFGCDVRLIPRQGEIKQWHFAHKSESVCNPETVLHRSAKFVIADMFLKAKANNWSYFLTRYGHANLNLAAMYDDVFIEHSVVSQTRSDLVFSNEQRFAIIEVVVEHNLSPATLRRYFNARALPVYLFLPTWDLLFSKKIRFKIPVLTLQ